MCRKHGGVFWSDHGDGLPRQNVGCTIRAFMYPDCPLKQLQPETVNDDMISSIDFGQRCSPGRVRVRFICRVNPSWDHRQARPSSVFAARDRVDGHDMVRSVRNKVSCIFVILPQRTLYYLGAMPATPICGRSWRGKQVERPSKKVDVIPAPRRTV